MYIYIYAFPVPGAATAATPSAIGATAFVATVPASSGTAGQELPMKRLKGGAGGKG